MTRLLCLLMLALVCTACMPALHHPRVTREVDVPEAPAQAFARAVKATMAVQGQIHAQDATLGMINATVQKGVSLNVIVTPHGPGSRIEVAHQVLPTHVIYGQVTLVDDWLVAYQRQP